MASANEQVMNPSSSCEPSCAQAPTGAPYPPQPVYPIHTRTFSPAHLTLPCPVCMSSGALPHGTVPRRGTEWPEAQKSGKLRE